MAELYDEIYEFLSALERDENIHLTEEARQMLILPIIEVQKINRGEYFTSYNDRAFFKDSMTKWRESLESILRVIKDQPASN